MESTSSSLPLLFDISSGYVEQEWDSVFDARATSLTVAQSDMKLGVHSHQMLERRLADYGISSEAFDAYKDSPIGRASRKTGELIFGGNKSANPFVVGPEILRGWNFQNERWSNLAVLDHHRKTYVSAKWASSGYYEFITKYLLEPSDSVTQVTNSFLAVAQSAVKNWTDYHPSTRLGFPSESRNKQFGKWDDLAHKHDIGVKDFYVAVMQEAPMPDLIADQNIDTFDAVMIAGEECGLTASQKLTWLFGFRKIEMLLGDAQTFKSMLEFFRKAMKSPIRPESLKHYRIPGLPESVTKNYSSIILAGVEPDMVTAIYG